MTTVERRLIHLRDLIEGAEKVLARTWRPISEDAQADLRRKLVGWENEKVVLFRRRLELADLPIDLTPTEAVAT